MHPTPRSAEKDLPSTKTRIQVLQHEPEYRGDVGCEVVTEVAKSETRRVGASLPNLTSVRALKIAPGNTIVPGFRPRLPIECELQIIESAWQEEDGSWSVVGWLRNLVGQ